MPRVSIATLEKAPLVDTPAFVGGSETRAFFHRDQDPIHVYAHAMAPGDVLQIQPADSECIAYVWQGGVAAGTHQLASGSSAIVERSACLALRCVQPDSLLVTFVSNRPSAEPRRGGHVHLLPNELVPRVGNLGSAGSAGGGLHADATCPTCQVWLHENTFPPHNDETSLDADKAVHSHSEDEVIFVTAGQMRLGAQLHGPGTAVAIAADTLYSFTVGPKGLSFVNFRPALPKEIRFKDGSVMDEVAFWKNRVATPRYLAFESI